MASDMDSFEKLFCGVWEYARDENLKEAMEKMGYPEKEIDEYLNIKPNIVMERKGDDVYFKFEVTKDVSYDCTFTFGKEFENKDHLQNPPSFHNKEVATFNNGVITFKAKTLLTGPGKMDIHSDFFIKDGELHTPMSPLNDTSYNGNRIYKRKEAAKK